MKIVYYFFLSLMFFSCDSSNNNINEKTKPFEKPKVISNPFLDLFEEPVSKDIHVFSPSDVKGGDKFKGKPIPKPFFKYFKNDKLIKELLNQNDDSLFATYKIRLSEKHTALIVRRYGHYDFDEIDLFIWDNNKEIIENRNNLSNNWGEGMYHQTQNAWLKDINKDHQIDVITRKIEFWEDDDENGEMHETDSLKVYLQNSGKFILSNQKKLDKSQFVIFE
jgi:hypothetical protein